MPFNYDDEIQKLVDNANARGLVIMRRTHILRQIILGNAEYVRNNMIRIEIDRIG